MKKQIILTIIVVFFFVLFGWLLYQNKALEITVYEMDCSEDPRLNGFTVVQISDLHNEQFGENQSVLLQSVASCEPDMIAITGDFIDCRTPNVEIAMTFIEGAVKIAPVFYVPGNHERWISQEYEELVQRMMEAGVNMMVNQQKVMTYGEGQIICMGVEDPDFWNAQNEQECAEQLKKYLQGFQYSEEDFTLLLSHRPELFEIYVQEQLDLVLTGHAHGGQFRLPLIGGLAAPNQGLFPQYDAGLFYKEGTNMIVSRGIGNSIIPLRINNPPEIVKVKFTLK